MGHSGKRLASVFARFRAQPCDLRWVSTSSAPLHNHWWEAAAQRSKTHGMACRGSTIKYCMPWHSAAYCMSALRLGSAGLNRLRGKTLPTTPPHPVLVCLPAQQSPTSDLGNAGKCPHKLPYPSHPTLSDEFPPPSLPPCDPLLERDGCHAQGERAATVHSAFACEQQ